MSDIVISIGASLVSRVLETADKVLSRASGLLCAQGRPEYTGGYLAWTFDDGTPIIAGLMWGGDAD